MPWLFAKLCHVLDSDHYFYSDYSDYFIRITLFELELIGSMIVSETMSCPILGLSKEMDVLCSSSRGLVSTQIVCQKMSSFLRTDLFGILFMFMTMKGAPVDAHKLKWYVLGRFELDSET